MTDIITFSPELKSQMVEKIKTYFERELDQEIGGFDAEFLLDFFAREMGAHFYNKGLSDGLEEMGARLAGLADDVGFELEKSTEA